MSEVLVRQLQQVLAPWDSLTKSDTPTHTPGAASSDASSADANVDTWVNASPQDVLANARAATTKLELARAALALFTSNAGAFRPALVKVFRFLFDHIDELRDEVAHLRMEGLQWRQGEATRAATTAGPSLLIGGSTPEEQNAVVAAYEKVRLTESRMAALVEEASVQRDHFRSQIEAQKRQQYHLEDLLQHQMELTQTLLDHRLRQELVGGGTAEAGPVAGAAGGDVGASFAPSGPTTTTPTVAAAPVTASTSASPPTRDGAGVENAGAQERGRRPAERRDAAYVQRLITRADRELTLEKTEDQLRELRAQQDELENKVQSLLKLNSKYARQCMELSARLSIIHENNIALSADVQLFQRDVAKEQQRSTNLQHALGVARGIVLTTLQVQSGVVPDELLEQVELMDQTFSANPWSKSDTYRGGGRTAATGKGKLHDGTSTAALKDDGEVGAPASIVLDAADEAREALRVVPDVDLRKELQAILQVDDVDFGGRVKVALMRLLDLKVQVKLQSQEERSGGSSSRGAAAAHNPATALSYGWLSQPSVQVWVPPYGLRRSVPRHLRSATAVPLLLLHPLLAEVIVHEMLTQRQDLLAFGQMQLQQLAANAQRPDAQSSPVPGAVLTSQQHFGALVATSSSTLSLAEFVELFILVIWLNRADRYLPLLPSSERTRLETEAQVRADAHARRVSRLIAPGTSSREKENKQKALAAAAARAALAHTTLWELRHVLHLVRPSTEAAQLPVGGLQLTYALDVASQQRSAGPLTYAYGLTSRGQLCEALFCLLRAEREALLALCRAVDAALVSHTRAAQRPSAEGSADPNGDGDVTVVTDRPFSSTTAAPVTAAAAATRQGSANESLDHAPRAESVTLTGWVPTVQFIRALLVLFPGYPTSRMEQLIEAAVAEGTESTESPATLFYDVLLPARMLPGPTTAATSADTSVAVGTRFASLFYGAICDDALESMQLVEDSVDDYAQTLHSSGGAGDPSGVTTVTARQITANAFVSIPRAEGQQWAAGLRSAIHRWPRLRGSIADPGKTIPTAEGGGGGTGGGSGAEAEADQVSTVARVPVADVMPYLRANVIVRRGLFAHADATGKTAIAGADRAANAFLSPKREKASPQGSPDSTTLTPASSRQWSPAQEALLQHWEAQWARYSSEATTSGTADVTAGADGSAFRGPSEVKDFVALLQQLDPYRSRPWASEALSRDNAVLHPLDYTTWSAKAQEAARQAEEDASAGMALERALKKPGKKLVKKAPHPR